MRKVLLASLLMMGLPAAAIPVPTHGLVAYYPFSGNADDASGNGHHGGVVGAIPATDVSGESDCAFYFDGTGDYIALPNFLGNPTNGTIAGWVYVESYETGFNQLNLIFGQNDNLQIGLGDSSTSADGKWIFRINSGGFKNVIGPLATTGEWTHVAGVWTGTEIILYLNGTETNRASCGAPGPASGGSSIGAHPNLSQNFWHGRVDELAFYNRALSESEILQLAIPPPLRLTDVHLQASNVVLSVRSLPVGMPAAIQRTPALQSPDWKNVATFLAVDAGTNVTLSADTGTAFYRVVGGDTVFRSGLALYLPLDGNTTDYSTNRTDGINAGVTFTNDWSGSPTNAAYFDGTGAQVSVPDAPSLDVTNLTLSF